MFPRFQRAYPPAQPPSGSAYWLPFRKDEIVVQRQGSGVALLQDSDELQTILQPRSTLYIGTLDAIPCIACEIDSDIVLPKTWHTSAQRGLFGRLDDDTAMVIAYAAQLLRWQKQSRYCPTCGHATEALLNTWGKHCPNCGYTSYPPVSPAILVLVHDGGNRVLLTHKPGWAKRFSCIAGFTEPCESLEECVQREVYEEVGVEVTDIRYVGSQPWPFPHQLMVGYTARYVSGDVRIDQMELDDAAWFDVDAMPDLPPRDSLARYIIDSWVNARHSPD